MSAWQVTPEHIGAIVKYWHENGRQSWRIPGDGLPEYRDMDPIERALRILAAENARSVGYRYSETCEPVTFKTVRLSAFPRLTAVECIKACDCLEYQSCECPDYRQTLAAEIIDGIRAMAISRLPGYDEAAWGIKAGQPTSRKLTREEADDLAGEMRAFSD